MPNQSRRPGRRSPAPAVTPPSRNPATPRGNADAAERLAASNKGAAPSTGAAPTKAAAPTQGAAPAQGAIPAKAAATTQAAPGATGTGASTTPAWAQRPHVAATLKEGAKGPEVETLQRALGLTPSGSFDAQTKAAVAAFQKKNGLGDDGIAGKNTLKKLGLHDELRSATHKDDAFIPKYRATAYSESDMYRTKDDPYAVGAISKPTQTQDDGGKTYGAYQFESYVYKDGSNKSDKDVAGSTLLRFVNWPDNPYSEKLKAIVKKNGAASKEFDALWAELTAKENRAFGQAQEKFLEHDVGDKVKTFFDNAKVPEALRKDEDLYDVALGTVNQYGGIAQKLATSLAGKIAAMKAPTAKTVGAELQDLKTSGVESHFKSSPKAWGGIRERIDREKAMFE